MFLELIIAILAGIFFGSIAGLSPGIHINLISMILVSLSSFFLGFTEPLTLAVFIVAMGVSQSFLDPIPAIFLGAPEESTVLSVLPGHRLLLKGQGYEAVKLTVIGSLLALILIVVLIPFTADYIGILYEFLSPYIGIILISIVILMILKEKGMINIFWGLFVFLISGVLGLITLNIPNLSQPLFPLLSGFFGLSSLVSSYNDKAVLPEQRITDEIRPEKKGVVKSIFGAVFSGSLTGMFPGLGPAQAAIVAMQFLGELGVYSFLILMGGMSTVNFVFSLATFFAIDKARNGAVVAILEIVKTIDSHGLMILLAVSLITAGISTYLALYLAKVFARNITKINYSKLVLAVILIIVLLTIYFSGWIGMIILITSTAIGLIAPIIGVKRSHAMGCLLLPVILFFMV